MRCFALSLFLLAACAVDKVSEADQALITQDSLCLEEAIDLASFDTLEVATDSLEAATDSLEATASSHCRCRPHCDKGPAVIPTCDRGYVLSADNCPTSCACVPRTAASIEQ